MATENIKVIGGELSTAIKIIMRGRPFLLRFKPEFLSQDESLSINDLKSEVFLRTYDTEGNPIPGDVKGWVRAEIFGNDLAFNLESIVEGLEKPYIFIKVGQVAFANNPPQPDELPTDFRNDATIIQEPFQVVSDDGSSADENALLDIAKNLEDGSVDVSISGTSRNRSELLPLYKAIEDGAERISFNRYQKFIDLVICGDISQMDSEALELSGLAKRRFLPFNDTDSYRFLKVATEAFLMANVGVDIDKIVGEQELIKFFGARGINFKKSDFSFSFLWARHLSPDTLVNNDPGDTQVLGSLYTARRRFRDLGLKNEWIDEILSKLENYLPETSRASLDTTNLVNPLQQGNNNNDSNCFGIIQELLTKPIFLELIWSYWQEEGMLVQTLNAISRRFQNIRGSGQHDPLAEMEISHLRPLNNFLWGYIQDEQHRLSVVRRAYEYDHHYGITLEGKALPKLQTADSRARFLEAFHGLLYLASTYYKDIANKLVDPDAHPILNALREIHFVIAEGMHNQYGDLPSTARAEMLMQQWILARPEFREYLPGRAAIPFTEGWMFSIASMNKLQGWTDVSPIHFNYLAKYGEQLLLSIRFSDWSNENRTSDDAVQWLLYFRKHIQGYIHSYKVITGVDLTATVVGNKIDSRPPSYHLAKRLQSRSNGQMPLPSQSGVPVKRKIVKKS